ncbi:aminotransferase class IV family protein [Streptomyces sp. NBC_01498]|uniref:aminotransferase class IV family protein n=1 Tax=Streptomyces sp. NBC_01498 TaxID=2975870 RepID=UPI002E7B47F4|nr:aminotransferase class IV family protein [Streptomyces sp. NBC_01498]WTL28808.1 aminotransferase class IV family protein [Streptomyces sp. NBC_01498]
MELNGRVPDPEQLKALGLTNYGHFTTMRVDGQRVRGMELHMERLGRDCRVVFGAALDTGRVREYVRRAVRAHGDGTSFVVRVSVFDPGLDIGHPSSPATPHVLVTTRPAGAMALPPLRVKTVPYVRDLPAVKHLGLFGALHARREAQLAGYDDALFHGSDGLVSEGGTWNVGFVDAAGSVVWPEGDVLPGVTMALLQRHHAHITAPVTLGAVGAMAAAFATNTSIGVRAVAAVDDIALPTDHPVLTAMRETYLSLPGEAV